MKGDSAARRLESVQVLRGLAAGAVLVDHIALELHRYSGQISAATADALDAGRAGVDVFFVISGFIMAYIAAPCFGSIVQSKRFLLRRVVRIIPAYWFYTTLMLTVLLLSPGLLRHAGLTLPYVLASYLFFPYAQPGSGDINPLLELGWTLNYEMYFYVLFAVAMLLPRRRGFPLLAGFFGVAVLTGFFISQPVSVYYWTRPIILEFLAGVAVGLAYLRGFRISRRTAFAAAATGLVWFVLLARFKGDEVRPLVLGIPAFLFIAAAVLPRRAEPSREARLPWRVLLLVGDASYSLYLSHMFVVRAVTMTVPPRLFGMFYVPVYCALAIAAAVSLALVSYRVIEVPGKAVLQRWLASEKAEPVARAASPTSV